MLIDLERCIGCYSCVVSCKQYYGTRPGVDYNRLGYVEWGEYPDAHQRYVSRMCNHCDDPPCVAVCPHDATYKTDEGPVLVDYEVCDGCGACARACPYQQRYLVTDDVTSFEKTVMPGEEESSQRLDIVEKCTLCYGRITAGEQPVCSSLCPGQCRIFGDLDDPESTITAYLDTHDATHLDLTSMYYVLPAGMSRSLVPAGLMDAVRAHALGNEEQEAHGVKAQPGIPLAPVAAGALVAAAAVGGGVWYRTHKTKGGVE
jgi:molybdopterin-containing oxidoreductase family iron-sulfur binding subunit